ncbi:1-acyl-sn-glycerol-3-phosphate acyltransferase [Brumimicrobium glaciale]|uniref:1-acyl-sn-glycerol-3-phosphate acyltransferase n=1 Tax=Brumimicrobium glaciale TaxID=200475 RepID=A0A4Q4KL19_9FLAO|nr:lysophospholipid acyltransferase family protein [Brumimicrobium glaciale]RYM33955.1 1-acyl-sn-glycerol-3-phosphate acyltransferase [Brumimicrobium glaciale]
MKYILGLIYYSWKLYIGLVFGLTLLLFYPALLFVLSFERLKPYSFDINVAWSRCVRIFCFYAVESNRKVESSDEPYVIIANHTSYLDIFILYSVLPKQRFIFMGKSEILKYPLVKTFFKKLNIPVDRSSSIRSAKAFIQAKNALKNGWSIVIFPEGGIPDCAPQLAPFKDGAFQLAKSTSCAILPITFINHFKLFSDPENFCAPAMPGIAKLHFHEMIDKEEIKREELNTIKEKTYQVIHSYIPQKND